MAKTSVTVRNEKRKKLVAAKQESRKKLKLLIKKGTDEEREDALVQLQKRKRNESSVRVAHRCTRCSRPHGVYRKFGICRICLRNAVMRHGDVPGVRKSSW